MKNQNFSPTHHPLNHCYFFLVSKFLLLLSQLPLLVRTCTLTTDAPYPWVRPWRNDVWNIMIHDGQGKFVSVLVKS